MIRYMVEWWDPDLQAWCPCSPEPMDLDLAYIGKEHGTRNRKGAMRFAGTEAGIPLAIKVKPGSPIATWQRAYLDQYLNPPGVVQVYRYPKPADEEA